ncbi:hypothetical protein [Photobacterium phosphoreum]|uniref:hypothetical protein n=1 Tax=Photobacterium phosphoreum TaxID=659 RepID=UPI0024311712|nr:hypothetical protein [Photobacterium phosphoreum]
MSKLKSKKYINSSFGVFSTNLAISFLGISSGTLVARMLGAEGRGELAQVILLFSLITSIFSFSINDRLAVEKENRSMLFYGLISVAQFFVLTPFVIFYGYFSGFDLLSIYLISMSLVTFYTLNVFGLMINRGELFLNSIFKLILPLSYNFLLVFLFLNYDINDIEVRHILIANFLSNLLLLIPCGLWLINEAENSMKKCYSITFWIRKNFKYIVTTHLFSVFLLVFSQIERIFIINYFPVNFVGQFVVSVSIVVFTYTIIINTSKTVILNKVTSFDTTEDLQYCYFKYLKALVLLCSLAFVLICIISPYYILILFGEEYRESITISYYYALAYAPVAVKLSLFHSFRLVLNRKNLILLEIFTVVPAMLISIYGVMINSYELIVFSFSLSSVIYVFLISFLKGKYLIYGCENEKKC